MLFFVLLALSYFQSKARTVSHGKITILPGAMITLSFNGVVSAFGVAPIGLVLWFIGIATAVWLGLVLNEPKGVAYSTGTQSFTLPGSWLPLTLMMAIFFTKYLVGAVFARQLSFAGDIEFIAAISFFYGCFSGLFLARAMVIWRATKQSV